MKICVPLLALLLLAACAPHLSRNAAPVPPAEKKPDKRVILDPALSGNLRVAAVRTLTGPDGILQFQVNVQNLSPAATAITYQIDWLDRDGRSLGIDSEVLRWLLLPRETAPLTMTAPTPLARDFRLMFRPRGPSPSPIPP